MFEERWYQIEAIEAPFKYLARKPEGHPLIAMPTGSGKTAIMVGIVDRILNDNIDDKVLVLSHDARILKQNYKAMNHLKNKLPIGLYSAGLNSRTIEQVTIAGIQSVRNNFNLFEDFKYVIIDECHTIPTSETSMYRKFLKGIGDHTRIGLTATPYRLGQGYIIGEDHMFNKIVIDFTTGMKYNKLVEQGYICKLVINNTKTKMDVKGIKKQGGDYSLKEMSIAFDRDALTNNILDEMVIKGKDKRRWLIFAIDIEHANHICEGLISRGVSAMPVHSDTLIDNSTVLNMHRESKITCIVSVGMLTTGYDDQEIDLIGILRPTASPNLHVQMPGRGQRVHESKEYCLVLDYAGNTLRLGPINKVKPHKKRKKSEGGEPIIKTCPDCSTMVSPIVKICPECGYEYKFRVGLYLNSSDYNIIQQGHAWHMVDSVDYFVHNKQGRPNGIRAEYMCGLVLYKEWILPDYIGYAGVLGKSKLKALGIDYVDLESTMKLLENAKRPIKIQVDDSGKYPNIIDRKFN